MGRRAEPQKAAEGRRKLQRQKREHGLPPDLNAQNATDTTTAKCVGNCNALCANEAPGAIVRFHSELFQTVLQSP